MFGRMIKMRGLNKRQVAVLTSQVVYLEEAELEGKICTNVHFMNGKWVTANHSIDEVEALLHSSEEKEAEERMAKHREMAKSRMEAEKEIESAMREVGLKQKPTRWRKEENPDGSWKMTMEFDAPEKTEG